MSCTLVLLHVCPPPKVLYSPEQPAVGIREALRPQGLRSCLTTLGQKSCRTKVPRIFGILVPNFVPNFPPNFPVLPFLVFLDFLVFSPCEDFLVFLSVFPFFSRDFRRSVGIKNPCFFGGFPCPFSKKTRKGRIGFRQKKRHININFLVRLLFGHPGNVPGTNRECPRDKVGLSHFRSLKFSRGSFRASTNRSVGNRDQKKAPKIPQFVNAKYPVKFEEKIH